MDAQSIWLLLWILCIYTHGVQALLNNSRPSADNYPAILLHLSDIHVSTNSEKYFPRFGDRQGDLFLLSKHLLPKIAPGAVIITGDLTDSKQHDGAGLQQEIEWQGYRKVLQDFTDLGGVALENILDHRGNHDGFNRIALRGGDYFTQYSASGIRGDAAKRVYTHLLFNDNSVKKKNASSSSSFRFLLQSLEEWKEKVDIDVYPSCPTAILLGLDFSEEPAFKNPLNFLGHAGEELADEIQSQISKIKREISEKKLYCSSATIPPIISYGHYPLSTIHHHSRNKFKEAFFHALDSGHSMQGAVQALADVGTTSYWSGHLHTEFGERLHRAHPITTSSSSSTPPPLENKKFPKKLIELETGAWKDDRRFRIAAIDGGAMSFIDLYLHTPSSPVMSHRRKDAAQRAQQAWIDHFENHGWGVTVADADAFVIENVALLTWPVDARYSPQPAVDEESYEEGTVRVLLFSFVVGDGDDKGDDYINTTESNIQVELNAYLPDGSQLLGSPLEIFPQDRTASSSRKNENKNSKETTERGSPILFTGVPMVTIPCVDDECIPPAEFVDVQVTIKSSTVGEEISQRWPVALRCSALLIVKEHQQQQRCWLAPEVAESAPMGLTWLEYIGLLPNWPVIVHRAFLLSWAAYVSFFLILPRILSKNKNKLNKLIINSINNNSSTVPFFSRLNKFIFWPFKALVLCASIAAAWQSIMLYSFYIILFPLYFTYLHDDAASTIPSAVFSFGVLGKFASSSSASIEIGEEKQDSVAKWHYLPTPDTLPVATGNLCLAVVPLTLWIACVVATHIVLAIRAKHTLKKDTAIKIQKPLFTKLQLFSLVLIVFVNYMAIHRHILVFLGPLSILLSPGLGWMAPLAVVLAAAVVKSPKFEETVLAAGTVEKQKKR